MVRYGLWYIVGFMVHVISKVWFMVHGLRYMVWLGMVYGTWFCRVWFMVHVICKVWFIVHGMVWFTVHCRVYGTCY